MKQVSKLVCIVVALGVLFLPGAARAASGDAPPAVMTMPAQSSRNEIAAAKHAKLDSELFSPKTGEAVAGSVVVEIQHSHADAAVTAAVAAAGGKVLGSVPGSVVLAEVPSGALATLAASPGVDFVQPPKPTNIPEEAPGSSDAWPAQPPLGDVLTRTNVAAWQAAGKTGQGVKVGLIDGFDATTYATQVAQGKLKPIPADHQFCRNNGANCSVFFGETHGNETAELITKMAPDVELYLVSNGTLSDLQAAITWLQSNGVRIISRSEAAVFDGPGDGTGPSADLMRSTIASGMLWVNSVGNTGGGGYWRGTWSDPNNNGYLNFNGNDEIMLVNCAVDPWLFGLRWSDWGPSKTDYDLGAVNPFTGAIVHTWTNDQATPGVKPLEGVGSFPCDYAVSGYVGLVVHLYNNSPGANGDILELMGNNLYMEYSQAPYSAASSFRDVVDAGTLSVGAITDPSSTQIAAYSSRGPLNNAPGTKPDLVTVTKIPNSVAPGGEAGTSFSTPTIAGLAAVVWGALGASSGASNPGRWLGDYLRACTVDRGAAGLDNDFGAGEVVLPAPGADCTSAPPTSGMKLQAGQVKEVKVTGANGVPEAARGSGEATGVAAVSMNVTVTQPDSIGYITVYPCGTRPLASNVNYVAGQTVPNAVIAPVSANGTVCFYSSATTHILADVNGWFPVNPAGFQPLTPARVFDTRDGTGGVTPNQRVASNGTLTMQMTGVNGVPASGVAAVSLNVTVADPTAGGYITVYPCGTRPLASNLNYVVGQTVPNAVIAPVSPDGKVCFYASGATHLLVDVNGWFPVNVAGFQSLTPTRVFDTRDGTGVVTPNQRVASDGTLTVQMTGRNGVPANGVAAVVLNVTLTDAAAGGYITVYPCGTRPLASNLNYVASDTVPNLVIAPVSGDGKVCFYALGATHLLADVSGWFPVNVAGFQALTPYRLFDTRS